MGYRLILYVLVSVLCFSCSPTEENTSGKPVIVATTGMIADAVRNIVKDSAEIIALMGPGVDPHLYKATQGDLSRLTGADVVFYNGLHLEGKMGEVLEKLGRQKPVIAIAEDIDTTRLRKVPEFVTYDPHIWFDVDLWKNAVLKMASSLNALYPELSPYFDANAAVYLKELDALHVEVERQIATIPRQQRVLITAHDAFGYFGDAYDIEVRGLQGISTLSEYGLRDVTNLVDFIIKRQIKAVFVETSVSQKAINAVVQGCREKDFDVQIGGNLFSDAMGDDGTPEGTYLGMVRHNVHTIVDALK